MNSNFNESIKNKKQMKQEELNSLNKRNKNKADSFNMNNNITDLTPSQNSDSQNNTYSLLSINQEINEKSSISKKKKKLIKKSYFLNIYKKESIIGICLNLVFWIWLILYILNYNRIIIFPRCSLYGKRVHMVYSHNVNGSNFINTLIYTFFNHFIVYIYPEVILFATYCTYVVYSLFNIQNDKFKENEFFLSKNTYIFFVIISFGELYKLYARKYLDI